MYPNIEDASRKTYLGMVTAMDDLVGSLIADLKSKGMFEDSVIIFSRHLSLTLHRAARTRKNRGANGPHRFSLIQYSGGLTHTYANQGLLGLAP